MKVCGQIAPGVQRVRVVGAKPLLCPFNVSTLRSQSIHCHTASHCRLFKGRTERPSASPVEVRHGWADAVGGDRFHCVGRDLHGNIQEQSFGLGDLLQHMTYARVF
jgi:hypothetical protein